MAPFVTASMLAEASRSLTHFTREFSVTATPGQTSLIDQQTGQFQFLGCDPLGIGAEFLQRPDFVAVEQCMEHQSEAAGSKQDQVFAIMHGELREGGLPGAPQRFVEQRVGLLAGPFRRYIIGCVQVHRIDLRLGHELQHLHHAGTARRDLRQFALLDDHVAVLFVLVAFDQLVARDRLVLGLAVQDLFDTRVIALVELIETDRLAARGGVKLNRNRDQAEGDVTLPDTVPHGYASPLAMLYTRAPSARLVEVTVSPIFFPKVPLMLQFTVLDDHVAVLFVLVAFDQLVALLLGVDADSAGRAGKSDSATRTAADAINGRRSAGQPCSAADSASTTTAAHAAVS